jgi:hypothetical protein
VDEKRLADALTGLLTAKLAGELASDFVKIRGDLASGTLERASPGKFVETFVQCHQQMATGGHEASPSIETYLTKHAENQMALDEGLRVIAPRVARTMYTLRSKRNIAHKNPVDPNTFDLVLLHQGAAWIMAELLRNATGVSMQEAGALIELVQTPVGTLVEEIDGTHLVHADVSVRSEILLLLHHQHPNSVLGADLMKSMRYRSAGGVRKRLSELRQEKLVHGEGNTGIRLTQAGYALAVEELRSAMAAAA